jgi:prepilin-type N-terminal cleavage/methylation domain-containing protein
MKRKQRKAGYTLIEVLMAMGVLASGSVAIMAMLQASTRGNMEAREMTMASQLAQRWVERLRRDSLSWTQSATSADATLLANTTYLDDVVEPGSAALWVVPEVPTTSTELTSFDYYGRDSDAASAHYCTNVRLEWIYPGQAMRADVRVWWVRRAGGPSSDEQAELLGCADGVDPESLTTNPNVRMVYTSTVLRYHPPGGS